MGRGGVLDLQSKAPQPLILAVEQRPEHSLQCLLIRGGTGQNGGACSRTMISWHGIWK